MTTSHEASHEKRILSVLTSHGTLGDTGKPTGFHYEELTTPYYALKEAGYHILLASPQGGQPPQELSAWAATWHRAFGTPRWAALRLSGHGPSGRAGRSSSLSPAAFP